MQRDTPIEKKTRRSNWVLGAVGVLWVLALTVGLRAMLNYEDGPAEPGDPPGEWPKDSEVSRTAGMPMVVVFAHPKCPCTDATSGELSMLMTRLQGKAAATVIFVRPARFAEGWEKTELWHSAEVIPGVTVFSDPGGVEARDLERRHLGKRSCMTLRAACDSAAASRRRGDTRAITPGGRQLFPS